MKVAVLGAGLTGLTVAALLAEKGHQVEVFEKETEVGGLCRTRLVEGYVYDLHGGHVFNSKHALVLAWAFSALNKDEWHYSVRDARIRYGGNVISYPFELSLAELPVEETIACIIDFFGKKGRKPADFHNWLMWKFGKSIAEKYLIPYNAKIWKCDLRKMAIDWVDGKMPLPTKEEILYTCLTRNSTESKMPHSAFYYPLHGGIARFIESILRKTEPATVHLDCPVEEIVYDGKMWVVNGKSGYDKVIWTIPLPKVGELMKAPSDVLKAARRLKWNSLTTFLFKSPDRSSVSWMYFPDKNVPYHRIVYQGNLSPFACPSGMGSYTVEMTGYHEPVELANYHNLHNLLAHEYTEFAYVLFDKAHSVNAETVKRFLVDKGIFPLGRFGEWQYYNMDVCMKKAFECVAALGAGRNN
jgi:protoporphyrinogen oxidase